MFVRENHCDVLIVGGGPSGLAAALALRQRGADVLVADAQIPPVDKACGEGIMPDSRRDLARLGVELDASSGAAFHGIRFCDERSSVTAEFPASFPGGLGVRRTILHLLLADRAAAAGVRFAWQTNVELKPERPVMLNGKPVQYQYLVGADGQASRVRGWAGLEKSSLLTSRFGFRIHYRVPAWSEHVEVHWSPLGQAYVTPVGENEICVSFMTRFTQTVRSKELLASLPALRERLEGADKLSRERGALTTTRRLHRVTARNIALVGDASGSVDAVTGEGLALGFRQAVLLADAVERSDLSLYDREHPQIMCLPHEMSRVLLLMDRWQWLRARALRALSHKPRLFSELLRVHLGDEPLKEFLLRYAPELGLRILLPSLA
jgi:menaquinone-9 beta-reductase